MKTIFITGSSSGLRKATAKLFAARGWKVIATMRYPEKETELSQLENVVLLPLESYSDAQTERQIDTNLLGVIRITHRRADHFSFFFCLLRYQVGIGRV